MTPADLYRSCRVSAYRLETLQTYAVLSDEERQRAFHAGQPLPPPRQDKVEDLRLITKLRQSGRSVGRIHVVDRPLSDYVRYELAVYPENAAAGEDVRIADRSRHPGLAMLTQDFAIFDGEADQPAVILFDYDTSGRLLGYEHTTDPIVVERCRQQYRLAQSLSEPLNTFSTTGA
jgi:hypothetical protein